MCSTLWIKSLRIAVLLAVLSAPCLAAEPGKKIYIFTDLEGVSGVYKFTQTRETTTTLAREAREYFMADLAEVIRGLRDGGATEILVIDGHGNQSMIPHLMPLGAQYITGLPRPRGMLALDASFDGLVLFGHHAMNGTPDGVLHHTQSSKTENKYWYNGVESGEIAQESAVAGHYNVPLIMVTGDEAVCREAHNFFGPAIVTVATKKGIAREAAQLYPFEQTRKALYEGARRAIAAIPNCKPYKLDMPIKAKKQYQVPNGSKAPKVVTKEGVITDASKLLNF